MNLNSQQRELIELASRYCDGSLSSEQFAKLEALLRSDQSVRRLYRDFTQLHAEIAWSVGGLGSQPILDGSSTTRDPQELAERDYLGSLLLETGCGLQPVEATTADKEVSPLVLWSQRHNESTRSENQILDSHSRRSFSTIRYGVVAASLAVLLLSSGLFLWMGFSASSPQFVARITRLADCEWGLLAGSAAVEAEPHEGDQLHAGQALNLVAGDLTIEFADGATTRVRGPARLELLSESALEFDAGVLMAEVPPRAVGFSVRTPNSKVVDLGTAFVVAVDAKQGTALQVVEGKVELAGRLEGGHFAKSQIVVAGQARQVFPGGLVEVLAFKPAAHEQFNWPAMGSASDVLFAEAPAVETESPSVVEVRAPEANSQIAEAPSIPIDPKEATEIPVFTKPIWLGNLFDDAKDATLEKAMETDALHATADAGDLGIALAVGQGAARKALPPQVTFDFTILGWNTSGGGADFSPKAVNDAANCPLGAGHLGDAIVTKGAASSNDGRKVEEGIGMHANGLVTFDLGELRKAAGWQGRDLEFLCDRVGVNDKVFGNPSSSVYAFAMTTGEKGVLSGLVNGEIVGGQQVSGVWVVRPQVGSKVKPLAADGKFATMRLPIPSEAKFLTLAITSAGDGVAADHAVWSGARLEVVSQQQSTK